MFLAGLFGWNDSGNSAQKLAPRSSEEMVTETLMLELGSHLKRAEKHQRERFVEYRRVKSGVDYTWLASVPRQGFEITPGEQLELRDICSKISPSQCGPAILRYSDTPWLCLFRKVCDVICLLVLLFFIINTIHS